MNYKNDYDDDFGYHIFHISLVTMDGRIDFYGEFCI